MSKPQTSTSNVRYFASALERHALLLTHLPELTKRFHSFRETLRQLSSSNSLILQNEQCESSTQPLSIAR